MGELKSNIPKNIFKSNIPQTLFKSQISETLFKSELPDRIFSGKDDLFISVLPFTSKIKNNLFEWFNPQIPKSQPDFFYDDLWWWFMWFI